MHREVRDQRSLRDRGTFRDHSELRDHSDFSNHADFRDFGDARDQGDPRDHGDFRDQGDFGDRDPEALREDDRQARMTVEEFARQIGMSARNIRAHQARGLLPRPVRMGRQAFYTGRHIRRAEAIKDLQRQGFNLVAISSILGAGEAGPPPEGMAAMLAGVAEHSPAAVAALARHGVIARTGGGAVRVARPRPIRAALALGQQLGLPLPAAIGLLARVLDAAEPAAGDLLQVVNGRLAAQPGAQWSGTQQPASDGPAQGMPGPGALARAQAVVTLLSEAMRVALENGGIPR